MPSNPTKTKAETNYRTYTVEDERCGLCSMFRRPNACTLVKGEIKPFKVCDEFDPK